MNAPLRIGTRASKLALAQAQMLRNALAALHGLSLNQLEIVAMTTAGDRNQQDNPSHWGYKGLFTKELEDALLDGRIDVAVHSMKDMPSVLPDGLMIAAMLPREDVRDAWISEKHESFAALPHGAVIGSSSARRIAQLKHRHPSAQVVPLRGNVQTRLQKIADGVAEATFLACAGLKRLGLDDVARAPIEPDSMLPAVAQGAIGMECRAGDERVQMLLAPLDHAPTSICVHAERAFLRVLDGSCRTPIAGLATLEGDEIFLRGEVLSLDGSIRHYRELRGCDGIRLGEALGSELHALAGPELLENMR
jgi:hydroxymethylbilane synthase